MTRNRLLLLVIAGAAATLGFFVATNQAAVRDASAIGEAPSVRGDLKVFYDLATGERDGSKGEDQCLAIEFHQEYLVLRHKIGGGRVVPIQQIRNLRWEGK